MVSLLLLAIGTVTADRERVQLRVSGESHLVLCEEKVLSLLPFSFSIGNVLRCMKTTFYIYNDCYLINDHRKSWLDPS